MSQDIICRYYGSMKGCRYGNNCRYSHSDPNSVPLCYYYNNCEFGNNCKFRHINFQLQSYTGYNASYIPQATTNYNQIVYPANPMSYPMSYQRQVTETRPSQTITHVHTQDKKESNSMIKNEQQIETNQQEVTIIHEKHPNEILCLYAADAYTSKTVGESTALYLRTSPYDSAPTHNKSDHYKMEKLLKFDEKNNIYYFPIGVSEFGLQFSTSKLYWPRQYTILMWVKWKRRGMITTFDSHSYTPIYGSCGKLGCASGFSRQTISDYKMVYDKWQCVIVFGGDNKSRFYIGDLLNEPTSVGEVAVDIGGHLTWRIGNSRQGPGDVGSIIVFDNHKSMESMIQLYYESILIMGNYWNKIESKLIKEMLMEYIHIHGIVSIIFRLIFGDRLVHQFTL
eukprot:298123_1